MMKKQVTRAECDVEFDWFLYGSVLAGTVKGGATACRTHFRIESPEPVDVIQKIIRLAKQGCFAEQMVQAAVPLMGTYELNGRSIEVDLSGEPPPPATAESRR